MKKILFSILSLGIVAVVAIGATRAYFSDTEEILGNTINTSFLEIEWDGRRSSYGGLNFPVELAPGENTGWVSPNGFNMDQRFRILVTDGSMMPNHYELHFTTTDFVSGHENEHGYPSTQTEYTQMVEVTKLYVHTHFQPGGFHNLLGGLDSSFDGNNQFLSLYDLENQIVDNIPVGIDWTSFGFELTMSPQAGNEFQGDSINLNIEVGAAQVAGQDVLPRP